MRVGRHIYPVSGRNLVDPEEEEGLGHLTTGQSRLAGRLGTKEGRRGRGDEEEEEEGEIERPKLKEGKDLRDLLNKDVAAVKSDDPKAATGKDSDDDMDYGAELERLMEHDAPPTKKRFMRMHADDEEEKIQAQKRLAKVKKTNTKKWPRRDFSHIEDFEDEIREEEEEDVVEVTRTFPSRNRQWVDFDNVEDDDPFNLFGTSQKETTQVRGASDDDDYDDRDDDRYRRDSRRRDSDRDKGWNQRLGGGYDGSRQRTVGGGGGGGGIDLRSKLQGRRRAGVRNW